ncbi:hypothetical protein Hanom_Chr09g00779221 [Helianthus anomalus]
MLLPMKDIIGPEWKITKQEKVDYLCPELLVWVPKTGFTELVEVNQKSQVEGGFSIAIFCYVLHVLPFNIQPIFKPFVNAKGERNGTYDDLLKQIRNQVQFSHKTHDTYTYMGCMAEFSTLYIRRKFQY